MCIFKHLLKYYGGFDKNTTLESKTRVPKLNISSLNLDKFIKDFASSRTDSLGLSAKTPAGSKCCCRAFARVSYLAHILLLQYPSLVTNIRK